MSGLPQVGDDVEPEVAGPVDEPGAGLGLGNLRRDVPVRAEAACRDAANPSGALPEGPPAQLDAVGPHPPAAGHRRQEDLSDQHRQQDDLAHNA